MTVLAERIARVEIEIRELRNDIVDLTRDLRGPGGRSVRDRLHTLENDRSAAKAAEAALATAHAIHEQAWTKRERIGLFVIAAAGPMTGLIAIALRYIH